MQADKLRGLRELLAKATPGEWMLATSCSWRRILTTDGKPVIVPTTQRSDNHPDMDCGDDYANAELAIAAVNALPELLAIAEAAEDLRADAMRWRWLADAAFLQSQDCEADFVALARKLAFAHGAEADAIIDSAMASTAASEAAALSTAAPVREGS